MLKFASLPTKNPFTNIHPFGNIVGELPVKEPLISPLLTPANEALDKSIPVRSAPDKFASLPIRYPLINFQPNGNNNGLLPVTSPVIFPLLIQVKLALDKSVLVKVELDKSA